MMSSTELVARAVVSQMMVWFTCHFFECVVCGDCSSEIEVDAFRFRCPWIVFLEGTTRNV